MLALGFFGGGQRMIQNEPGMFIGPIATVFGYIIDVIFNVIYNITIYHSLGFSIILLTIIVRALMLPLAAKQQKSMVAMQRLAPEIEKIKKKYPNKDTKSQQQMNAEIQKTYSDNKVNPLGGCLPLFIQMPMFFGLSFIMNQSYRYVSRLGGLYNQISDYLINYIPGYTNYVAPLAIPRMPGNAVIDLSSTSDMNRVLNSFDANDWDALFSQIPDVYLQVPAEHMRTLRELAPQELLQAGEQAYISPERLESLQYLGDYIQGLLGRYPIPTEYLNMPTLQYLYEQKMAIETFFGMGLTEASGMGWPGILIPIFAVASAVLTSFLTMKTSVANDDKARMQQKMMMIIMPVMMGVMTIGLPAGVGIFWITSSVFQIGQQMVLNKRSGIPLMTKKSEA